MRHRRSLLATLAAVALAGASLIAAAPASAAVISNVITDVRVSPTNPAIGSSVRTDIDWCVPDGTQEGDTFTLTLSEYLRNLPAGFELRDPAGELVATAAISTGTPAVITFRMTAYAATHQHVCGTAFVQSLFSSTLTPGTSYPFTSTTDTDSFTTSITPRSGPGTNENAAFKFGGFSSNDQGHTDPNAALRWYVLTPEGPLSTVTITDTVPDGYTINCSTVTVGRGERNGPSLAYEGAAPLAAPTVCTPQTITVVVGPLAQGKAAQLLFTVNLPAATGPAATRFSNTATVTTVRADGGTQVDNPSSSIQSSTGGGGGNGVVPAISIQKWSTIDGAVNGDYDTAPGKELAASTPEPISFTITNTGTEPLTQVVVNDTTTDGPSLTGLTCDFSALGGPSTGTTWAGPFAIGATFPCTGVLPGMASNTTHADMASVAGIGQTSLTRVTAEDPWFGHTQPEPAISIVKKDENGNDSNTAEDKTVLAADHVDLEFTVTNTGEEPLADVQVTDTVVANGVVKNLVCTFPDGTTGTTWAGPLAPGAEFPCSAELTELTAGLTHEDSAAVSATGAISGTPTASDDPYFAEYTPPAGPGAPPVGPELPPVAGPAAPPASSGTGGLAITGGGVPLALGGIGLIALVAGAVLVFARRRRLQG